MHYKGSMKAREILKEFYSPEHDMLSKAQLDDTRRPRLTLLHLQKLRKARDAEKYESAQHIQFLPDMYGAAEESPTGM